MKHLLGQAGTHFRLDRSRNFYLLSPFTARKASYQVQFLELTLRRLSRLLGVESRGRHVVLIWRNADEYLRYVSHFSGLLVGNAGTCIRTGLVHTVSYDRNVDKLQATLAHELVHDLLSDSKLPLWLEDGIAQNFAPCGVQALTKDVARMRQMASTGGLKDFWSGRGFAAEEIGREFCYAQAEILTRLLLDEKNFRPFLARAKRADCGQEACHQAFGRSLGSFLSAFLGAGDWEPSVTNEKEHELWALLHESRWEQAIELTGADEAPFSRLGRAIALSETPRWREALKELADLGPEFKSPGVLVREIWLGLCSEEADCAAALEQLEVLEHPSVNKLRASWLYARGLYKESLEFYPPSGERGFAAWKLGDRKTAEESADSQDLMSTLLLVELCLADRETERAETLLKICREEHPPSITTWELSGRVAELRGLAEEARKAYRHCLEIFEYTGRAWKPERERVEVARLRLQALGSSASRRDGEIGFDS
ncbi:MAG: hypothetical protein KF760_08910 [Candidatus Eremiobacteraeota bacterium]|nr:hypothetical protein [Candidatus Eremiobacteraeota bacterium]